MNAIHSWYAQLLFPHRRRILLASVLLIVHALCPTAVVFLTEVILDDALLQANPTAIAGLPIAIILLYVISGSAQVARSMITRSIAWKMVTTVRSQLFESTLHLSLRWRNKKKLGELLSALTDDVNSMQYMVSALITIVQKPLTIAGLLFAAHQMHPDLTWLIVILFPVLLLPIRWLKHHLRRAATEELQALSSLRSQAAETYGHFTEVKTHRAENQQAQAFEVANEELYRKKMRHILLQVSTSPILEICAATGLSLALYIGSQQVASGSRSASELLAFLVAVGLLSAPLKGLSEALPLWQKSMAGATRVHRLLNETTHISDTGTQPLPQQIHRLSVQKISFSYDKDILFSDLTIEFPIAKTTAITGVSGSGKTTLMLLLFRLLEPQSGSVCLNGIPIHSFALSQYRSVFSVLSQQSLLFHDTIYNNLTLGITYPFSLVQKACQRAQIDRFIESLPNGYHSSVAEMGAALSGGQRQRLCIARALIQDAPILILDEPFLGLDRANQESIWTLIQDSQRGKTILLVTHQRWLWAKADTVITLPFDQNSRRVDEHQYGPDVVQYRCDDGGDHTEGSEREHHS